MIGIRSALDDLTAAAKAVRTAPVAEDDWAEVANRVRAVEVNLADFRRAVEGDALDAAAARRKADPSAPNQIHRSGYGDLVESRRTVWSFNEDRLLASAVGSHGSLSDALAGLKLGRAINLKWRISGVEDFFQRHDLSLRRAAHEVADGDPDHHVGRTITPTITRRPPPPPE